MFCSLFHLNLSFLLPLRIGYLKVNYHCYLLCGSYELDLCFRASKQAFQAPLPDVFVQTNPEQHSLSWVQGPYSLHPWLAFNPSWFLGEAHLIPYKNFPSLNPVGTAWQVDFALQQLSFPGPHLAPSWMHPPRICLKTQKFHFMLFVSNMKLIFACIFKNLENFGNSTLVAHTILLAS